MRWQGRRQSTNIEDRRGGSGGLGGGGGMRIPVRGARGGGIGIVGLLVIGAVLWFGFGINPMFLFGLEGGGQPQVTQTASGPGVQATPDPTDDFVATVLASTEDVWTRRFQEAGESYPNPQLVLFNDAVASACGNASSSSGPFYCPSDSKLYIDLAFFRQLEGQLNAPGDFAQAYVIAHEVGHHVQNLTGVLPRFAQERQILSEAEANEMSVRVELQADCFAGLWAHDANQAEAFIEAGDIDEALNAAGQIGDDTLQKRSQGYVVPESFNHGTSEQRRTWFRKGFDSGDFAVCDTMAGDL